MAEATTAIQVHKPSQIERAAETFAPRSLTEAFAFADMVLMSGMAPKSYLEICKEKDGSEKARAAVVVALQFGLEVGFQPMQALQCIANINGNPSVWGDGALALVQSSGLMEWIREDDFEVIKKNSKATCQVKRRGDPEVKTVTFSYDDAKKSGIFERGVWKTYPYRMCLMRARAFALRDKFPDVLKGLKIAEEVMDFVDAEPATEPPRIQATVVVPKAEEKATTAPEQGKSEETAPVVQTVEADSVSQIATITIPQAKAYYKAYSDAGKLPDESKAFLKKHFNFEDSRMIPEDAYDFCMKEAREGFPSIKVQENLEAEPA